MIGFPVRVMAISEMGRLWRMIPWPSVWPDRTAVEKDGIWREI